MNWNIYSVVFISFCLLDQSFAQRPILVCSSISPFDRFHDILLSMLLLSAWCQMTWFSIHMYLAEWPISADLCGTKLLNCKCKLSHMYLWLLDVRNYRVVSEGIFVLHRVYVMSHMSGVYVHSSSLWMRQLSRSISHWNRLLNALLHKWLIKKRLNDW